MGRDKVRSLPVNDGNCGSNDQHCYCASVNGALIGLYSVSQNGSGAAGFMIEQGQHYEHYEHYEHYGTMIVRSVRLGSAAICLAVNATSRQFFSLNRFVCCSNSGDVRSPVWP
jgi:hypothetical protein